MTRQECATYASGLYHPARVTLSTERAVGGKVVISAHGVVVGRGATWDEAYASLRRRLDKREREAAQNALEVPTT